MSAIMGNKQTSLKSDSGLNNNVVSEKKLSDNNLKKMMSITNLKYPHLNVPWSLHVLTEHILKLKGLKTKGIFRISARAHEIDRYVNDLNAWKVTDVSSVHIPVSVLKKFLRELDRPLIPSKFYQICISENLSDDIIRDKVIDKLPKINRIVLIFLIDFLRKFADPEVVEVTQMSVNNLAIVLAPNFFLSHPPDPSFVLREILFLKQLVESKNIKAVPYL